MRRPKKSSRANGTRMSRVSVQGPEIFVGLVGAVGADLDGLTKAIEKALKEINYQSAVIRLSELLQAFPRWKNLTQVPENERILDHMRAGTDFRTILARGDALAAYGITAVRSNRKSLTGNVQQPAQRQAYIFRSLKHPHEVAFLRRIYGKKFVLVAAYLPREQRLQNLAQRIADSKGSIRADDFIDSARALNKIDEEETGNSLGQNVRETFPLADVFIDGSDPEDLVHSVRRFVELWFGHPFHTPSKIEYGMFFAKAAAVRSAALPRQVGAAITTAVGDVVATGTNEVPKFNGGLYWPDDPHDKRDYHLGYDVSDRMKQQSLSEVLDRLRENGWLTEEKAALDQKSRVQSASMIMRGTQLMKSIEFSRAVHAEVAAILSAGLNGVSVKCCTLFTTTFPCHDCARHIVAAGIRSVVYIEPYPKSLASEFHQDSITVDQSPELADRLNFKPFVGIAPTRYLELFDIGSVERKKGDGTITNWDELKSVSLPKLTDLPPIYLIEETATLSKIEKECKRKGLL